MSQLSYLEHTLGSVHNWPQDILRYLFLDPPTVQTLSALAAFFYGNHIPFTMASAFFVECFSASRHHLDFIRTKFVVWGELRDDPHLSEYYDMKRGQVVLLRGADYSDGCVVCEESAIPIRIGLGRNIFPPTVIQKLAEMRANPPCCLPFSDAPHSSGRGDSRRPCV